MEKKITLVKAEILFSRQCILNCSYCSMVNEKENTLSVEQWKAGIDQLKILDCQMAAFYGAEPLLEFKKLRKVVPYAESIGIDTTIITTGLVDRSKAKLLHLNQEGARSLSMSYDIHPHDIPTRAKSNNAFRMLSWFRDLPNTRDVAAIVTLTRKNFKDLPATIFKMSANGIWTFFDLYHWDRGQAGCKVSKKDPKLAFREDDLPDLVSILLDVEQLSKEKNMLVHANSEYLNVLRHNTYEVLRNYNWKCNTKEFPSWVTVDCDGFVYPCDDFNGPCPSDYTIGNISKIYEDRWAPFWKMMIDFNCPGCAWCTHIQAHAIKSGKMSINDYVHGKNNENFRNS